MISPYAQSKSFEYLSRANQFQVGVAQFEQLKQGVPDCVHIQPVHGTDWHIASAPKSGLVTIVSLKNGKVTTLHAVLPKNKAKFENAERIYRSA